MGIIMFYKKSVITLELCRPLENSWISALES